MEGKNTLGQKPDPQFEEKEFLVVLFIVAIIVWNVVQQLITLTSNQ